MAEIRKKSQTYSPGDEVLVKIVNQMIFIRNETPILDPDAAGNRTFTTNYNYVPHTLCVTLNGLRQKEGVDGDYEELGGNQFKFNYSIMEDDEVIVDYIKIMS